MYYKQKDEEHQGIFEIMLDIENHPDDQGKVDKLQELMRDHFYYEEGQFCDSIDLPWDYCKEHKKKHDIFFKTLTWVTNPVSQEYVAFAKNWLAQHIKNTDFKYRYKLATQHKTPEPYIWNNEFEVFVSICLIVYLAYIVCFPSTSN